MAQAITPLGLAVRTSSKWFQVGQHHKLINRYLVRAICGEIKRLMIFLPPQHGKSTLASMFLPACYLGTFPDRRIILGSFGDEWAHKWGRETRDLMREHGEALFGVTVSGSVAAEKSWQIHGRRGGMASAGLNGAITGKAADGLFIIDDPIKSQEEAFSPIYRERLWGNFESAVRTRCHPTTSIVMVKTRWHQDDIGGRIELRMEEDEDFEHWEVLRLPAIAIEDEEFLDSRGNLIFSRKAGEALWPEKFPLKWLEEMRNVLSPSVWQSLYQQDPRPEGATEWPSAYFGKDRRFDEWPTKDETQFKVLALDPSKGREDKPGDYSSFIRMVRTKDKQLFVQADMSRTRNVDQITDDALRHIIEFQPDMFGIECNVFQALFKTQIVEKAKRAGVPLPLIYEIQNNLPKRVRIYRLSPELASQRVLFKDNDLGTGILLKQLRDYPHSDHDDGPDSMEMAKQTAIYFFNFKMNQGKKQWGNQIPAVALIP